MSYIPLINGEQHSWASIDVEILGRVITGIVEINYDMKRKVEDVHGAGDEPVARGFGNKEYKADITLYQFEVDAIELIAGGFDITRIPAFQITVHYRPTPDQPSKTHLLGNARFTGNSRSWKQGQTIGTTKFELKIAGLI